MKRLFQIFSLLVALCAINVAAAQNGTVEWSISTEKIDAETYELQLKAVVPDSYHIYDMQNYEVGPNPTIVEFSVDPSAVELVGDLEIEGDLHLEYDDIFEIEIGTYEGEVLFTQRAKLLKEGAAVGCYVEWMVCDENTCLPLSDAEFTFELGDADAIAAASTEPAASAQSQSGTSIWALILEAILWGFAALLTPCVFPMIPMTVSFFMKSEGGAAKGRLRALLYGIFIVALYTLPIAAIIIITRVLGGDAVTADIFNWIATHWFPNLLFFTVFMVFAASFFGAFEITLPSWAVNRSDEKANNNSLGGIFFLALTLVLVSFSCTGPIVGSVLIKSTSGEFWNPIITMLAFSSAFALPFAIFAFFPSTLKSLPKSGGWLNSVKVVLGFIELALGMKFLSVADQTYHWGLLDREVYLAIWIVIFTLLGLYLLGKLKFAHDSELKHISVGRLGLAIASLSFVVYMIPGMWGAPLKALSGYLPPMHTQDFVVGQGSAAPAAVSSEFSGAKYSNFLHLPHNLQGFFDMEEAEAYAQSVGKPLFVDITGHGCVNCREMEARVWSDPRVLDILRNDYVVVALYTDDKKVLPESDWVTTASGKTLKGLGKINSHYALETYGVNAQPYYILQDSEGVQLNSPRGYNLDIEEFVEFLEIGKENYAKNN